MSDDIVYVVPWGDSGPYGGYDIADPDGPPTYGWWSNGPLTKAPVPRHAWERYETACAEKRAAEAALDELYHQHEEGGAA